MKEIASTVSLHQQVVNRAKEEFTKYREMR
jgi:hypothetical protein